MYRFTFSSMINTNLMPKNSMLGFRLCLNLSRTCNFENFSTPLEVTLPMMRLLRQFASSCPCQARNDKMKLISKNFSTPLEVKLLRMRFLLQPVLSSSKHRNDRVLKITKPFLAKGFVYLNG